MQDNTAFPRNNQNLATSQMTMRTLLTQERSQKLDLLIHLLANLKQALIICGPEGIGKTTLLNTLQESRGDQWWIFPQQGAANLSFEAIINDLNRFLNLKDTNYSFDLTLLRHFCEKQKVILIIDDAGQLVPGLIAELIELAETMIGLKLVFAMTYDQFHIKRASDKAIDDCHFIELPPLDIKQCRDFLQNMSAQPGAAISFQAVTDQLVNEVYRETHGIPGKILQELPKLNRYQQKKTSKLGLWIGITLVMGLSTWAVMALLPPDLIAEFIPNNSPANLIQTIPVKNIEQVTKSPLAIPKFSNAEPALMGKTDVEPKSLPEEKLELSVKPAEINPISQQDHKAIIAQPIVAKENPPEKLQLTAQPLTNSESSAKPAHDTQADIKQTSPPILPTTNEQVTVPLEKKNPKVTLSITDEDSLNWIKTQPSENYTLQLMVLSNKDAAIRFLKKYAEFNDSLKFYAINSNDQEKYVLIYGSFKTANEARMSKANLPTEFKQGLEKRFRIIQNQSHH